MMSFEERRENDDTSDVISPIVRLGDVATIVMGQSPPGTSYNEVGHGFPFFQGVKDFRHRSPVPRVYCAEARRIAEPGDILLSLRAPIGRMNTADRPCGIGRGLAAVRARDSQDTRYIEYVLRTMGRRWIAFEGGGSVFGNVTRRDLDDFPLPWPSRSRRHTIAHVIGSLEDRIDQSRRIVKTLDAMARAIFRDWFVDFGPARAEKEGRIQYLLPASSSLFSGTFVESTVGPIPEEWSLARFGYSFELTMGQSPPGSTYNTEGRGLPFVQGRADFGTRYASPRRSCSAPARVAAREDTLVSVRAPIGSVNIARDRCCIGRGVAAVRHRSGSAAYTYQSLCRLRPVLESFESTGTVFGAVTKTQFESLLVVEPPAEVVEAFDRLVGPLHERIRRSVEASEKLGELRDRLGERLVSGQLRPDGRGRGSAPGRGDAGGQRVVGEAGEGRVTGATGC